MLTKLYQFKKILDKWKTENKISEKSFKEIDSLIEKEKQDYIIEPKPFKSEFLDDLLIFLNSGIFALSEFSKELFSPFTKKQDIDFKKEIFKTEEPEEIDFKSSSIFEELARSFKSNSDSKNLFLESIKPLFNEYIFWLLGISLLLAGSIFGVREAFRVLNQSNQIILVAFAFIIYQFLFSTLGLFLNKKSPLLAKALIYISILLFPISFSLLGNLYLLNPFSFFIVFSLVLPIYFFLFTKIESVFNASAISLFLILIPILILQTIIFALDSFYSPIILISGVFVFHFTGLIKFEFKNFNLFYRIYFFAILVILFYLKFSSRAENLILGSYELAVIYLSVVLFFTSLIFYFEKEKNKFYLELIFLVICFVLSVLSLKYLYFDFQALNFSRLIYFSIPLITSYLFFRKISIYKETIHPFLVLVTITSFLLLQNLNLKPLRIEFFLICIPYLFIIMKLDKFPNFSKVLKIYSIAICYFVNLYLYFKFTEEILVPIILTSFSTLVIFHLYFDKKSLVHFFNSFICYTFLLFFLLKLAFTSELEDSVISNFFPQITFILTSVFYYAIGSLERFKSNEKLEPFVEVSLLFSIFSLFISFSSFDLNNPLSILLTTISILFFFIRSFEDKTVLTGFFAVLVLFFGIEKIFFLYSSFHPISFKIIFYSISSVFLILLSLILPITKSDSESRYFFGIFQFPFYDEGFNLFNKSIVLNGFLFLFFAIYNYFSWAIIPNHPDRIYIIFSWLSISVLFLILFVKRLPTLTKLRGSVFTLILVFLFLGLGLITNRLGRPLEPRNVGLNYSFAIIGLYLLVLAFQKYGLKISTYLKNEGNEKYYFHVPLQIILILSFVLFFKLLDFKGFIRFFYLVPPVLFLAISVGIYFYFKVLKQDIGFLISNLFFAFFILFTFIQFNLFGVELTRFQDTNFWYPKLVEGKIDTSNFLDSNYYFEQDYYDSFYILNRFLIGITAIFLIYSILFSLTRFKLSKEIFEFALFKNFQIQFVSSSFFTIVLICFFILYLNFLIQKLDLVYITIFSISVILLNLKIRFNTVLLFILSVIPILIQLISRFEIFPIWSGFSFSLLGLIQLFLVYKISKTKNYELEYYLEYGKYPILVYLSLGVIFSFTTRLEINPFNLIFSIFQAFLIGISGFWLNHFTVSISLILFSIYYFIIFHFTKKYKDQKYFTTALILILTGSFLFIPSFTKLFLLNLDIYQIYFSGFIPYYTLNFALFSAAFYFFSFESRDEKLIQSYLFTKEICFVMTGFFTLISIYLNIQILPFSNLFQFVAILIILIISFIESFKNLTLKSVYIIQASVLALYFIIKSILPNSISIQVENILFVLYGFLIIGINHFAEKKKLPIITEATSKFLSITILIYKFSIGFQPTYQDLINNFLFSAIFYGLGKSSNHKIHFVLSSFFVAFGLNDFFKMKGVTGIEIYSTLIGMFLLSLSHIYSKNLNKQSISILRIVGGLFLYLPSAYLICFEIGRGDDAYFTILFGLICLVGILFGMFFHIKAYVFKGSFFFLLNLIVNLLQEGLRNELFGFILLTVFGLLIIFSLIYYNLKKEIILKWIYDLRNKMKNWE